MKDRMENPKEKIYSILEKIASEMGINDLNFSVEKPKDATHGDLAANVALALAKNLKKNPLELAQEIIKEIGSSNAEFEKIEAVSPGFINFYLSLKYLQNQAQNIIEKGDDY